MGWFKKTLAKVGVGSAGVGIALPSGDTKQGSEIDVVLTVTGGEVAQQVNAISLSLQCDFMGWEQVRSQGEQGRKQQRRRKTCALHQWSLPDAFTINAGEERVFHTAFILPQTTPLSLGDGKVWLEARLDIPLAKDASGKVDLAVKPDDTLDTVLDTFEQTGFRITSVKNEEVERQPLPFSQILTLEPVAGDLSSRFREVTLTVMRQSGQCELQLVFKPQGEGIGAMVGRLTGSGNIKRTLMLDTAATAESISLQVSDLLSAVSQ
ncbi:sporulation protein [Enterovibrio paralichthyis]|uniref:sporulation protein n=1 Tax=Enterovibrio paralichthyis TaxID=2853805 RepID=UPI001C456E52|nr:sporulation protein [Enterovibrio paralichthyis]MBV7300839.1 sporulation protein [Enterovibrio paralichthyis]